MSNVARNTVYQIHFDHILDHMRGMKFAKWEVGAELSIDEVVKGLIENNTYHFGGPKESGRTTFIAGLVDEDCPGNLLYISQTKADCDMFAVEFKHIRPGVQLPKMKFGPLDPEENFNDHLSECTEKDKIKYVVIDHADNYKGINARQDGLYKTYRALCNQVIGLSINTIIIHVH